MYLSHPDGVVMRSRTTTPEGLGCLQELFCDCLYFCQNALKRRGAPGSSLFGCSWPVPWVQVKIPSPFSWECTRMLDRALRIGLLYGESSGLIRLFTNNFAF